MLKYGLKIWSSDKQWFKEAVDLVKSGKIDFIELYIIPTFFKLVDFDILKCIPITLHSPHFNILELKNSELRFFKNQLPQIADLLKSKIIVVHGGVGKSQEVFKKNISKINDKRILIENMCKIGPDGIVYFGHSLEQLKFIKEECGFDICLDFVHAAKSAISQKIYYKDFIESLISELSPHYFHIYGTSFDNERDEHQNIFEGDFDVCWSKKILTGLAKERNIHLVFEVPKYKENLKNDIKNIDHFKNL